MENISIGIFKTEAKDINNYILNNSRLKIFLKRNFLRTSIDDLRVIYARWLKVSAGYSSYNIKVIEAASASLKNGDSGDKLLSSALRFHSTKLKVEKRDHEILALNDIVSLGNPDNLDDLIIEIYPKSCDNYREYFINDINKHPYAILGARNVMQNLLILTGNDLLKGLKESRIENINQSLSFLRLSLSELNPDHTSKDQALLEKINGDSKIEQIKKGARFMGNIYKEFLNYV